MPKRWQLFHATDFRSLMNPCFIFCRILGIFPYKINNSIFEISKLHYVVSILTTCTLCAFELLLIYGFHKFTNFEGAILVFDVHCHGISSSFIAIITLVLSSPRMRLLQTIMEISSKLPPESYLKLSRLIHFKDIFGFFYVATITFIYFYTTHIEVISLIYSEYTMLLIFQTDMLYMNCVCILKACLKEINNNLLHMKEFIVNGGPCISTMFYYEQRNPCLIINLKTLKKQHLMVSNTIQRMNMILSFQLLATIFISFKSIIFTLYYDVVKWENGLVINLNESMKLFLSSEIYQIIRILLVVWACETGKNEAQEIRTIIHDVLNSTRNKQVKNELHLFSLQILHCKSTFLAKCITVDATLLTMMTSTVTTYMLISLQFLVISHAC